MEWHSFLRGAELRTSGLGRVGHEEEAAAQPTEALLNSECSTLKGGSWAELGWKVLRTARGLRWCTPQLGRRESALASGPRRGSWATMKDERHDVVLPPAFARRLVASAHLALVLALFALSLGLASVALTNVAVYASSVNYWRNPVRGVRRRLDMVMSAAAVSFHLALSWSVKVGAVRVRVEAIRSALSRDSRQALCWKADGIDGAELTRASRSRTPCLCWSRSCATGPHDERETWTPRPCGTVRCTSLEAWVTSRCMWRWLRRTCLSCLDSAHDAAENSPESLLVHRPTTGIATLSSRCCCCCCRPSPLGCVAYS